MRLNSAHAKPVAMAWLALLLAAPCPGQLCPHIATRTDLGSGSWVEDIAVGGGYLYAAGRTDGLSIWDVNDPAHPVRAGRWMPEVSSPPSILYQVGVNESRLALVQMSYWWSVITARDPSAPVAVVDGLEGRAMALMGNLVLVDNGDSRFNNLRVLDVSRPETPVELSSTRFASLLPTGRRYLQLVAIPNYLYAFDSYRMELFVIDLHDPRSPREIGPIPLLQARQYVDGGTVEAAGGNVLVLVGGVGCNRNVFLVDISDPTSPAEVGPVPGVPPPDRCLVDVALRDGVLVAWDGNLTLVDVSDPAAPSVTTRLELGLRGEAHLAVDGTTVFLALDDRSLRTVDISDPIAPRVLATVDAGAWVFDVKERNGVLFVCDCGAGLKTFDVSNPTHPRPLGRLVLDGCAARLAQAGTTGYVATGSAGLSIIDLSDPANPVLLATHETRGYARSVAVSGSLVAVGNEQVFVDDHAGLELFDVTDPSAPERLAFTEYPRDVTSVALRGTAVFAVDGDLHVLDASDPANLLEVQTLDPDGYSKLWAVWLVGDLAVTSGWERSFTFGYDVTDPLAPELVWEEDGVYGWNFDVDGTTAFLAGYVMFAADFSDPRAPRWYPVDARYFYPFGVALVDGVALVGSSPFLDAVTLECRAPEADFHAGQVGRVVELADRSRYAPETRSWDLGDGTTSTEWHLVHRYADPGTYVVTLTVTNAYGSSTASRSVDVLPPRGVAGRMGR